MSVYTVSPDAPALDERLTGRRTLEFLDALRPRGAAPADPKRRAEWAEFPGGETLTPPAAAATLRRRRPAWRP